MMVRTAGKVIFCALLVLAVAGVILEGLAGSWFARDPLSQLNLVRNATLVFDASSLYAGGGRVLYRRDAFGFRGRYPDPSHIDILTVGGSATDQRYLTEGQTWQDVLSANLSERGKSMSVVNAGVDGQSSYGHLKDFEAWFPTVPGLRPRHILIYLGVNDVFSPQARVKDDLTGRETWRAWIQSRSALYRVYRTLRGMSLARFQYPLSHRHVDFQTRHWTVFGRQDPRLTFPHIDVYRERLAAIDQRVRRMGAIPIWVSQPSRMYRSRGGQIEGVDDTLRWERGRINGVDFYHLLDSVNRETMAFCRRTGGVCIDLEKDLPLDDADYYDYFHYTPQGARKIGDYLAARLRDLIRT